MRVTFIGHATVEIELDGVRLLTDPVLGRRVGHLRRHGPLPPPPEPDAVLVSHAHADHLDVRSLRRLGDPAVITTAAGAALLRRRRIAVAAVLRAGESFDVGALTVVAVPAHHDGRRVPVGPRSDAIGFRVDGSRSVYFAGDTELFDEMAALGSGIDLALLPVSGWGRTLGPGHMGPADAARAAAIIRPAVAIPIHWGTLAPIGSPAPLREPAIEFAREVERRAPAVRVLLLEPGQSTEL